VAAKRGPLEQEIYEVTGANLRPGAGSMEAGEMVVVTLIGHMAKIEDALLRLAREIDAMRAADS
jgi:hypothetical protein